MYEEDILNEIFQFIETHLDREITLKKISDRICYSEEYTCRFFKKMTGENLFDHIRSRRLIRAADELGTNGGKIIDIALSHGFNSPEGFSRAFSSYFGMPPLKFRNCRPEIKHFMPRGYKVYPLEIREKKMKKLTVFTQVIERPERKLYLVRGEKAEDYFEYCEELGCDIWGRLLEVENPLYEPVGVWLPEPFRTQGTSFYAQGVETAADHTGNVPENLDCILLPASEYMVFQSEPYEESDETMMEVILQVQDSIKKYNPEIYGYEWAENNGPRFQLMPIGERGYIEGLPVKRKKQG